ncbi:phosphoadenosine phosphosulfate reductase family protein [Marinobacter sp.]|uniref:phosphoadenosine phosphosulfate reductase domain-containing protein n=1 Tax=Marinobacter sp. TaxID=50741 RepID=UPI003A90E65C
MSAFNAAIQVVNVSDKLSGLDLLIEEAKKAIKRELALGSHLVVAYSGGKDSSCTLALTIWAAHEWVAEGNPVPTIHVVHSDTRVENPLIHAYNQRQLAKIRAYSSEHLPVQVWLAEPGLSHDYLVSLIGGRTIASVGSNTKCQQTMKAYPLKQLKGQIKKQLAKTTGTKRKHLRIVSVIGTRFDESLVRGAAMEARGESATEARVLNAASGDLVLSPIANFTADDVFELIGRVTSGRLHTYDSWEELLTVYRDMNGGDCMVVAYVAGTEVPRAPCSARTGCWTCLRVSRDKSAENMLADEQGRFNWMRPLNELRNYIQKRHFDPSARCWLGRSINEERGTIKIQPNAYSPSFCKELLGIALTIQRDERIKAWRQGVKPRFTLLTLQQVIAIDMLWARYGYQQPFTAVRLYRDIEERGKSVRIPDYSKLPDYTANDVKFSAEVPFCDRHYNALFNGLRNIDAATADCEPLKTLRDGTYALQSTNEGDCFDIDEEGAELFYEFELDYALERVTLADAPADAVLHLMGLGTIQLYKGGYSDWDRMLRMSNQIHRHQIQPFLHDPHALIERLRSTAQLDLF